MSLQFVLCLSNHHSLKSSVISGELVRGASLALQDLESKLLIELTLQVEAVWALPLEEHATVEEHAANQGPQMEHAWAQSPLAAAAARVLDGDASSSLLPYRHTSLQGWL